MMDELCHQMEEILAQKESLTKEKEKLDGCNHINLYQKYL